MLPFPLIATRIRLTTALLLVPTFTTVSSVAATPTPSSEITAELEVVSGSDCTTRDDLMARVRARAPRVTFDAASENLTIRARFSSLRAGTVVGDLTFLQLGSVTSTRRVVARSCREAADAVALIIAVTLDPTSAQRADRDTQANAPDDTSSNNESVDEGSHTKPPRTKPVRAPAAESERPIPPESLRPESSNRSRFGLLLAAQAFVGPAPGAMPGIALYAIAASERAALWSPAVVIGATHVWRSGIEAQGGTAEFALDALSVDACPVRARFSALEVRPCVSVLGGRFAARGSNTENPASGGGRPFGMVGGSALVAVRLVWRLEASARFAAGANLVRDSFEFTPVVFHDVPAISVAVSLGAGVRWP